VQTTARAAGPGSSPATGTGWPAPVTALRPAGTPPPGPLPATAQTSGTRHTATPTGPDQSGRWLRCAAAGLVLLAGAAAAVSFTAQYVMVDTARRLPVIAGLEAAIPDAAALVFACLGIALALHGGRALRARFLNVAAVGTSVFMNSIAAAPGWRGLAIWVMPPVAYALASDTLIGVVRAHALARRDPAGAGDSATPLAMVGGLALWLLRLALAPVSTLTGFRAWALAECPVAPGRRAPAAADRAYTTAAAAVSEAPASVPRRDGPAAALRTAAGDASPRPHPPASPGPARTPRPGTKTARFLALAGQVHGPLAQIPLASVGPISADLAPQVGLNPGAARTALRRAVLAAMNRSTP
jgi:hypothetical protein